VFRFGPNATRKCLDSLNEDEGEWDEVDISNCTTRSSLPLVVYSTYLITEIGKDITQNISQIENEVHIYIVIMLLQILLYFLYIV